MMAFHTNRSRIVDLFGNTEAEVSYTAGGDYVGVRVETGLVDAEHIDMFILTLAEARDALAEEK